MAVSKVYFSGYTPYPKQKSDKRLPYLSEKISGQIRKTALGAEISVKTEVISRLYNLITRLKEQGFEVVALEQTPSSINLDDYIPASKVALIVGNELDGLTQSITDSSNKRVQIPMLGEKESLNVSVAGAIALYFLRNFKLQP